MPLFVILRRPGKNYVPNKPMSEQAGMQQHVQAIERLFKAGKIVLAGPFLDESGGVMTVVDAESAEEARSLMGEDPWVGDEVLGVDEVRPYHLYCNSLGRLEPGE